MLEGKCWYFMIFSNPNLVQFYSSKLSRIQLQPQRSQKADPTSQSSLSYFSIAASPIQRWIVWGCCWQILSVDGWMDGLGKNSTLVALMTISDRLLQSMTSFINCASKHQVLLPIFIRTSAYSGPSNHREVVGMAMHCLNVSSAPLTDEAHQPQLIENVYN